MTAGTALPGVGDRDHAPGVPEGGVALTRTAGWLTDEGLATVWEQMHRLVQTGRFDDASGPLRVVVKRAYAGERWRRRPVLARRRPAA